MTVIITPSLFVSFIYTGEEQPALQDVKMNFITLLYYLI